MQNISLEQLENIEKADRPLDLDPTGIHFKRPVAAAPDRIVQEKRLALLKMGLVSENILNGAQVSAE